VQDPRKAAQRSTVALKYLMAVTGFIMIGYLLAHMYGNLKAFSGLESFDGYAEHIREIGEPILPEKGFLWIARVVLLGAVLGHAYAAVKLWKRDRAAATVRGASRYQTNQNRRGVQRSYASFTLRWGGVVIALFIVYHLLHLSANNTIHPGGESESPYVRLVNGFDIWWVVASYTVAMLALGFHIRHGIWSAATTLGANTSPTRRRNLNLLATGIALVITVGFLTVPYAVLLGGIEL
jgi:succinate dehydrogenase / fumarate reductase cytochrome b subunit